MGSDLLSSFPSSNPVFDVFSSVNAVVVTDVAVLLSIVMFVSAVDHLLMLQL